MVALRDFLKLVRPQCLFFDDGEGLIHIFFSAVGNEPQRCCRVSFAHETDGADIPNSVALTFGGLSFLSKVPLRGLFIV